MPTQRLIRNLLAPTVAVVLMVGAIAPAQAEVTFEWATVGNAGNAGDAAGGTNLGAVGYTYNISKHEVTNGQYVEFLSAKAATDPLGFYHTDMNDTVFGGIVRSGSSGSYTYAAKAGRANSPVNFTTYYDSVRFVNWLHNGQGNADTETGAYTVGAGPQPTVTRNQGVGTYFLPTEDEFFKAAFHKPTSGMAGDYFIYAGTDILPQDTNPTVDPTGANYNEAVWDGTNTDNPFTDVGAYTANTSGYGTFDQSGNVSEWVDGGRKARGGNFLNSFNGNDLRSYYDQDASVLARREYNSVGFRVVTPEPSSAMLLAFAGTLLMRRRRA